jgi:DNA-binding beta-propeller fold protein YncE
MWAESADRVSGPSPAITIGKPDMMPSRPLMMAYLCGLLPLAAPIAVAAAQYSIAGHLPATGGAWDYAVIDPTAGRLYLAQAGVTAVDLKSQKVTSGLIAAKMTHGVAALGDGIVAVDDSQTKTITVFEGASGKVLSSIATADSNPVDGMHALDALLWEPRTRLLVAINGESGLVLLADPKTSRVVGTIAIGGHPEFAVANGAGQILVNVNRGKSSEVVIVDLASRKVTKHIPLHGCEEATGLAFDEAAQLAMSVCGSGALKVIDAHTDRVVATVAVGLGADAVMFDAKRRLAFVAGGESGTLSVVAIRGATYAVVIQTLDIPKGTRLGAVDIDTGRLYLPSAKFGPPKPPIPFPSVVPGSFEFLVIAAD